MRTPRAPVCTSTTAPGMIGTQVVDTAGAAAAVLGSTVDPVAWDAFVERHVGLVDGGASDRFVERFLGVATEPLRSATAGRDPGKPVLPFRAMSATSEAPARYRNTAGDRGAVRLIREAIDDLRSRQRLVRYLVAADMHKRGADTLLGNLWWILDPLLQMVVYVVLVTLISRGQGIEDYPCSSSRRSCPGSGSPHR